MAEGKGGGKGMRVEQAGESGTEGMGRGILYKESKGLGGERQGGREAAEFVRSIFSLLH